MDLTHDWKALNEVLFQSGNLSTKSASSLVLLEDDTRAGGGVDASIIDGVTSTGRAFTERGLKGVSANKEKLDALAASHGVEQAVVLSKKTLDQCVAEAALLGSNYFQQLQTLRAKVEGELGRKRGGLIVSRRHFVLDFFGGRVLRRFLPRRFNVLLFVDTRSGFLPSLGDQRPSGPFSYRAILLSYSGGQLDQFFEPDFSSLHENRLMNWELESDAIGQYLVSRYLLPCCGLFMHRQEWESCAQAASQGGRPWGQLVRYYDDHRAAVFPRNWLVRALLATQRLMVYFGRL